MCRVIGTAYVKRPTSGNAIPHDERGVENGIREDHQNRRDVLPREVLERLERERGKGEPQEMAPRVAEEDPCGGRVVDEESGAGPDEPPREGEVNRSPVH